METTELSGLRYRCLEECGFCCTFTPEVSGPELAKLRGRFPALPVTRSGEMLLIAFQGSCGACALLKDRRCTAYEDRPAHCRYFPFHVYFGRKMQAYVNRCCRGVEVAEGGTLQAEFKVQVLDNANAFRLTKEQARADSVHAAFERAAREAGMWGDVDEAIALLLERGSEWFLPATWPDTPTGEADEAGGPEEAWQLATAALASTDPVTRPYHLGADLRWLGFRSTGATILAETLGEDGTLQPFADLGPIPAWPELPETVRDGLFDVMRRLAERDLLAGAIFHLVDEAAYEISVADAAAIKVGDMAADLALRAEILHRLGMPWPEVAAEADRFYDSAFLDLPTIGGWL